MIFGVLGFFSRHEIVTWKEEDFIDIIYKCVFQCGSDRNVNFDVCITKYFLLSELFVIFRLFKINLTNDQRKIRLY